MTSIPAFTHGSLSRAAAFLFALLLFVPFASAQQAASGRSALYTQGLLWKIEGSGRAPSYVFGTIHVSDPRVSEVPPVVSKALADSGSFALELTPGPETYMRLVLRMMYGDGRNLEAVIGRALFKKVAAASASASSDLVTPEVLQRVKPWGIGLILSMPDSDPSKILDLVLHAAAVDLGKSVHALETPDEQADVLDQLSERDQIAFLRQALDERERLPAMMRRLVDAYAARDLGMLYRISFEDNGDAASRALTAKLMQRLLFDRNVRMAQRADALFASGSVFVAVGALHLYGERGVLALLARQGNRVSRVY